jgi:hypothetical protein
VSDRGEADQDKRDRDMVTTLLKKGNLTQEDHEKLIDFSRRLEQRLADAKHDRITPDDLETINMFIHLAGMTEILKHQGKVNPIG